jgi:3',5'-cyclic AMP phosphodiesterase CpdA
MKDIRIIQFGDTHFTRRAAFDYDAFKKGVRILNTIDADYCIHVGDITQEGLVEDYDLASLLMPAIARPVLSIPGNHDVKNVGWVLYERYFGERNFIHRDDRVLILGIDCSIPDRDDSRFSEEDLRVLDESLSEAGDRFKVVVFHSHLFPIPGTGRERNILYNSGDVIEVLQRRGVHVVLNGHKHTGHIAQLNDIVVINSGTFSSYKTRQGEEHSFNLITIFPGKNEVTATTYWIESGSRTEAARSFDSRGLTRIEKAEPVLRLVQLSDLRVSDGPDFLSDSLDSAIDEINRLKPDQVCVCGNLVERGLAHEYDLARGYLSRIEAPLLIVPGFCDLRHTGKTIFQSGIGDLERDVDIGGLHLIGINTALPDTDTGVIGRGKLNAILEKRVAQGMINAAVLHHKLTPAPGIREHGYIEDAGSSLRKFVDSDTDILLSGHRHVGFSLNVDGLVVVNSGTVSSRKHYSVMGNTFNILTFYRNGCLTAEEHLIAEDRRILMGEYRLRRWDRFPDEEASNAPAQP